MCNIDERKQCPHRKECGIAYIGSDICFDAEWNRCPRYHFLNVEKQKIKAREKINNGILHVG